MIVLFAFLRMELNSIKKEHTDSETQHSNDVIAQNKQLDAILKENREGFSGILADNRKGLGRILDDQRTKFQSTTEQFDASQKRQKIAI